MFAQIYGQGTSHTVDSGFGRATYNVFRIRRLVFVIWPHPSGVMSAMLRSHILPAVLDENVSCSEMVKSILNDDRQL